MRLQECINFLLSKSQQKVHQISKSKLKPYGVTPVQYGILQLLWEKDGQYASELADVLHLEGATMTGIIDRLVKRSLVERRPDLRDRRVNRIYLTEEGQHLEAELRQQMVDMNKEVLSAFSEEEVKKIKQILKRIID
jgi:DNA-binding MarR family transcriptional regulator